MAVGATTQVDGRLEAVSNGVAIGWAWRRGIDERVEIEVLVDGRIAGTVVADHDRPSLRSAGIGDGAHAFSIELPADLGPGRHVVEAVVLPERTPLPPAAAFPGPSSNAPPWDAISFASATPPPGGAGPVVVPPRIVLEPAPPRFTAPVPAVPPDAAPDGLVESITAQVVSGWVRLDPDDGDRPPQVTVHLDGELVARAAADIARADIPEDCRGFRVTLQGTAPLGAHAITCGSREIVVRPGAVRHGGLPLAHLDAAADGRAILGRDGWLFEERDDRWTAPLPADRLDRLVGRLRHWRASCELLGVVHLVAVVPARERVATAGLPDGVPAPPPGPLAQVRRAVRDSDVLDLIELLPLLGELHAEGDAVLRTDDAIGAGAAFVAVREIVKAAALRGAALTPLPPSALDLQQVTGVRGRLAGLPKVELAGGDDLPVPDVPEEFWAETADLPFGSALQAVPAPVPAAYGDLDVAARAFESPDRPGRAVLLADRREEHLESWLAESVGLLTVIDWVDPVWEPIELDAPDLVVQLLHEDRLHDLR